MAWSEFLLKSCSSVRKPWAEAVKASAYAEQRGGQRGRKPLGRRQNSKPFSKAVYLLALRGRDPPHHRSRSLRDTLDCDCCDLELRHWRRSSGRGQAAL